MLHIITERLVLKPHTQKSLAWLNETFNDPDEDYFNGDDPPKERPETLEETQKLLDQILNRPPDADIIDYAIHKKDSDEMIGCGMIALINPSGWDGTGEIGVKGMQAKRCRLSSPIVSRSWG